MKLILLVSILFALASCDSGSTRIQSKNIASPLERIQTLEKYLKLKSPIQDCHFDIFDVNLNANRSIPGATSRDYAIALLLDPADIGPWLKDMIISPLPQDTNFITPLIHTNWINPLIKDKPRFKYKGIPEYYTDKNKILILYREQGLVFLRIRQD